MNLQLILFEITNFLVQMADLFEQLPQNLKKLVNQPNFEAPNFKQLSSEGCKKLSNSVKTKTLLDLLKPVQVPQPTVAINLRPTILVFCQPSEEINIDSNNAQNYSIYPYSPVSYAEWIEGVGARCVPLPYNINEGSMQFLLERAHGLLIPGGGSNLYKNFNKREGQGPVMVGFMKIWRFIQKLWGKGVNFQIWGTCLGFQMMLLALTGDVKILSNLNSRGHQVQIYSDYENSNILKKMSTAMRIKLENFKLINFMHSYGISVKKFMSEPKLIEKLKITQISKDKDGKWFCSGLEGKNLPIFISQYHPEKQSYQWTRNGDIKHNKDSVQSSHFLASSFVNQCRNCRPLKDFSSPLESLFYSFHQYKQIHTPQKMYKVYAIDFKYRDYDKEARKDIKNQRSISTQKVVTQKSIKAPFV